MAAPELKSHMRSCPRPLWNLPILQAFLYQINGYWTEITNSSPVVKGAIICLDRWFGSLCVHRAVGQRHAVGSAIGLTLVTVLIVHHVFFGLAALDLIRDNNIF